PGSPSSSLFQVVPNQFGLDLIVKAPTSNNSVMPPPLTAYDNVGRRAVPPPDAHQARLRPDDHPARRAQRLRDGLLQDHLSGILTAAGRPDPTHGRAARVPPRARPLAGGATSPPHSAP